jgi:beta-ureidopropionase
MIEPYNAVGLIPSFWGIRRREEIKHNIEHLKGLTKAAFWLSNLDIPVRLLAIPEGALMGFNDEVLDVDHADYARTCCIDIPGPETDEIGKLARQWNVYIMAQAKARHKDWKNRFFNIGFIVDPDGNIILQHYKLSALLPVERSVSPHDVYDWWIKKYGRTLDAFWPVADTKIGRLGIMMAMEGNYPENGRGLAMNGAEVVYRASMPAPFTENDIFEISNRARALENNMYIVAPNIGSYHLDADRAASRQAARHQWFDVRFRRHQYRSAASPPRVGAGHQLDEGCACGIGTNHLRETNLPEKSILEKSAAKAR